jgi:hypothetical protein
MASTFAVTRNHLIFGLCLPLAVLLGYLLAEPFESTTLTIMVMVFAVLGIPVMMRWYHPLLVFSWHLAVYPMFLPGRPQLWVVMSVLGLFFAVLNRSMDPDFRLSHVSSLTRPMLVLAAVVVATAIATGGIGLNIFGSSRVGGKGYVYLIAAIVGYFALSSRQIKSRHAALFIAIFFLPGISSLMGWLAPMLGASGNLLMIFFPLSQENSELTADFSMDPSAVRFTAFMPAAICSFNWLLARYGVAGILDLARPWRLIALASTVTLGCFGGFRSMLILMGTTFLALTYLERLWRSSVFLILVVGASLFSVGLIAVSDKLPLSVQRTLSFLPLKIDPLTRDMAVSSTEWRVEMWKAVYPQIPQYLFLGKGYNLSGLDLFMMQESTGRGLADAWQTAAIAGDYHNGPLSVIIPFGIWGVLAVGWLLYAGARFLYTTYREGPEELKLINRFFLALFMARILFFIFIFGALSSELFYFTGILGLSVALNMGWHKRTGQPDDGINNFTSEST